MKKILRNITILAPFVPALVSAQTVNADLSYFDDLLIAVRNIINFVIPLLIALGVLLFIWGLVTFIFSANDEEAKKNGRSRMIWGIITLFVIVSIWGLVGLLNQVSGVQQGATFKQVQTSGTP